MNIQIYAAKKNPDVLKAERFFKERRIPYQTMDLKKHKLGRKELELFVRAAAEHRRWWIVPVRRRWNAPWLT